MPLKDYFKKTAEKKAGPEVSAKDFKRKGKRNLKTEMVRGK